MKKRNFCCVESITCVQTFSSQHYAVIVDFQPLTVVVIIATGTFLAFVIDLMLPKLRVNNHGLGPSSAVPFCRFRLEP